MANTGKQHTNVERQPKCDHEYEYLEDRDHGDWCEEVYECSKCGRRLYKELPD